MVGRDLAICHVDDPEPVELFARIVEDLIDANVGGDVAKVLVGPADKNGLVVVTGVGIDVIYHLLVVVIGVRAVDDDVTFLSQRRDG